MRYIYLSPPTDIEKFKKLPVMKKEALAKLIKDRIETKVITSESARRGKERQAKQHAAMFKELSSALEGQKTSWNRMLKLGQKEKWVTSSRSLDSRGNKVVLRNVESMLVDAFLIKRMREDRAQAEMAFDSVYGILHKNAAKRMAKNEFNRFAKLANLQGLDAKQIRARQVEAARMWIEFIGCLPHTGADVDITSPGVENGEGNKTDRASGTCSEQINPKGLISLHRWPLKRHITSVKQQGRRGTCTAFGTTSSVESAISVKYGRKFNLSEQDLYKKQRLDWSPSLTGEYNEDGYFPILSMLFQIVGSYVYPFERDWGYNPSYSRTPNGDGPWTMSCIGYNGPACSDTSHQAQRHTYRIRTTELREVVREVCDFVESIPIIGIIGGWVCDTVTDLIEVVEEYEITIYETNVPGTSRYKVTGWTLVWDPFWDNDITLAKAMLANRVPLILCFRSADSFDNHTGPDGRGYIVYNANETLPDNAGGHCVAIVGHIDNENIPPSWGLQPGAGGGYFILKNSWGHCWADRGFAYAPYAWVNKWGENMVAITNVERI